MEQLMSDLSRRIAADAIRGAMDMLDRAFASVEAIPKTVKLPQPVGAGGSQADRILDALASGPKSQARLSSELGIKSMSVGSVLFWLRNKGRVVRVSRGVYRRADR